MASSQAHLPRGIIYRICNTVNGMSYIGQTRRRFIDRYYAGKWWEGANWVLGRDVARFGLKAFEVEFLEEGIETQDELDRLERYYIKLYGSLHPRGYNLEDGGEYSGARMAKVVGQTLSDNLKQRHAKTYKVVDRLGKEYCFSNLTDFARQQGIHPNHIWRLVHGKCKTTHGFGLTIEAFEQPRRGTSLHIVVGPDDKEYTFYNAARFAREHGLSTACLHRLFEGKVMTHHGFRLKDGPTERRIRDIKVFKYDRVVLDENGHQYTVTFRDIGEFLMERGINKHIIYQLIHKPTRPLCGLRLLELYNREGDMVWPVKT